MAALNWYAMIRLANGNQQRVTVRADNWMNSRLMIETQFGSEASYPGRTAS
jgi:hypothetical protein